jgi:hypothetical protein
MSAGREAFAVLEISKKVRCFSNFFWGQTLPCHRLKSASGAFTNQTNGSYINIKATTRRPLDIHISLIALKIARRFRTIRATGTNLK